MTKIVEYNPYHAKRKSAKHGKSAKSAHKARKTQKNPYHAKSKRTLRNPFGGFSEISGHLKSGLAVAAGIAGAWASNAYIWSMLPSSVNSSESLKRVRGAIPALAGIFLAGQKNDLARKAGIALIGAGLYDIGAGMSNGAVPTLGREKIVYRPVPVRAPSMGIEKPKVAPVGFEAAKRSATVGFESRKTPYVRGSLAARSALVGAPGI